MSDIILPGDDSSTLILTEFPEATIILDGGLRGPAGLDGHGVPLGGSLGKILAKSSNDDFATEWISPETLPVSINTQLALDAKLSLAGGTLTGALVMQMQDLTPGIPLVDEDGVFQLRGADGTKHIIFWPDMDGDGDYDADIYFKNNAYLVSTNGFHFRTYDFGGPEQGRVIIKSLLNSTSGLRTNYIQSGVNFSGSIEADLAITRYNSSFAWALFDESQNGYMGLGFSLNGTTGLYKQADARLHVYDGTPTVAIFEGYDPDGTARIAFKDITTSSGSTVTIGANGDNMILRAHGANMARLSDVGFYVGGNVAPTARLDIAASDLTYAALRIRAGVDPTSPFDGDFWYNGTDFKFRDATTTRTIATKTYVDAADALKANDSAVVHNTGTETVGGAKTFSSTVTVSSTLTASGAFKVGTNTRTGDTTLTNTTIPVNSINAAGGNITITLPTAVGNNGLMFVLKRIDNSVNTVTIATTSSQTIDGATTLSLTTQWQSVTVVSNNANWIIIGELD